MRTLPPMLAVLLAAAPALARDAVPAATPAGPARSCIPIIAIRESRVRSDRVIDFVTNSGAYRNTLPQSCPGLGFERRFSYETSLSALCSTDIITVFAESPPMRGASCGLGEFQPVTLARPVRRRAGAAGDALLGAAPGTRSSAG